MDAQAVIERESGEEDGQEEKTHLTRDLRTSALGNFKEQCARTLSGATRSENESHLGATRLVGLSICERENALWSWGCVQFPCVAALVAAASPPKPQCCPAVPPVFLCSHMKTLET